MTKDVCTMKWPSLTAKAEKLCVYEDKSLVRLTPDHYLPVATHHFYRLCHRITLMKQNGYFGVFLTTFEASVIFEAAGTVSKIGSSLKPNHTKKFSQVRLVQIRDPLCTTSIRTK